MKSKIIPKIIHCILLIFKLVSSPRKWNEKKQTLPDGWKPFMSWRLEWFVETRRLCVKVTKACVLNYRVRWFISYRHHILPNNRSTSLLFTAPVEERVPTTQRREQWIYNKGNELLNRSSISMAIFSLALGPPTCFHQKYIFISKFRRVCSGVCFHGAGLTLITLAYFIIWRKQTRSKTFWSTWCHHYQGKRSMCFLIKRNRKDVCTITEK